MTSAQIIHFTQSLAIHCLVFGNVVNQSELIPNNLVPVSTVGYVLLCIRQVTGILLANESITLKNISDEGLAFIYLAVMESDGLTHILYTLWGTPKYRSDWASSPVIGRKK